MARKLRTPRLKAFMGGQRVRYMNKGELYGKTGTVVRCCIMDNAAWVKMDEPVPDKWRSYSADDSRANHVKFYPEECEAVV